MEIDRIIRELMQERERLTDIIRALERLAVRGDGGAETAALPKQRRGRKSMDEAARRDVSERMRRYWARRRQGKGPDSGVPDGGISGSQGADTEGEVTG